MFSKHPCHTRYQHREENIVSWWQTSPHKAYRPVVTNFRIYDVPSRGGKLPHIWRTVSWWQTSTRVRRTVVVENLHDISSGGVKVRGDCVHEKEDFAAHISEAR